MSMITHTRSFLVHFYAQNALKRRKTYLAAFPWWK
jgi:hypothetical protein